MKRPKKIRLGELLVEKKLITQGQLDQAIIEQQGSGEKIGRVLVQMGLVNEQEILNIISDQLHIPFVDLGHFNFNPDLVRKLPETHARRYRAIVLSKEGDNLLVGMGDPTDIFAYDEITRQLNTAINLAVVSETALVKTFNLVYRRTDEIKDFAQKLDAELTESDIDLEQLAVSGNVADAPVVKLLQSLFEDALQVNASDIHIEPDEKILRIRQRIDGVLYEHEMEEKNIATALVMRLKIMSGLDISEKRLPQDGRFHIRVKEHSIDVRLSTMPTQHGESVVMRLLDQSGNMLDLEHLGMPDTIRNDFRSVIHAPHGLILVTGPTGSGKSTTLYAALQELNSPGKKIITAEDPVEYRLPRMNQVQVNTKIGLNFAEILRAALRQDPDVILIGEMRDQLTVEIAIRAAMTGHLVLSTLHTNDAMHSLERLLDMGSEGYLIATVLRAVVAQRLVRKICSSCKFETGITEQQAVWLASVTGKEPQGLTFYQGRGCARCHNTGYVGRIGVYELLEPDEAMLESLRVNDTNAFAKAVRQNKTYKPLLFNAIELAEAGITSLQEAMRLSGEEHEYESATGNGFEFEQFRMN